MSIRIVPIVFIGIPTILGCWLLSNFAAADISPRLKTSNAIVRDASGRQVFLWGINVGEKSSIKRHISWHQPEDFVKLRQWGMNAIRLLIFWSAIEPQPGYYDEQYLASVDERIAWAKAAGLYVILDMHQDLWSEAIPGGNGAPAWATVDDGLPHNTIGPLWSTAYLVSPRVHRAFDHFWNNSPGPDGVGLQERFALAWKIIAQRYAQTPEVIGFNLLNEPFIGSKINDVLPNLWAITPLLFEGITSPDIVGLLADEDALFAMALEILENTKRHEAIIGAIAPIMHQFEKEKLMPMYQRVYAAIRQVHRTGIIFLEPCVLANFGVPSAIVPLQDAEGKTDPFQVYFPHVYDIVTDTPFTHLASENRLTLIAANKRGDADRMGLPLFVGEWGAFYGNPHTKAAARLANNLLERYSYGAFYWDYQQQIEDAPYFEVLAKPRPLALAGTLREYNFEPQTGHFVCRWEGIPSAGTSLFAAPLQWSREIPIIQIQPENASVRVTTHAQDPKTRYMEVSCPEATLIELTALPVPQSE